MIYPGGKQCTSNNYLISCAVIISCASWQHFSNGGFIPTIWLMSHICAVSLLSLKETNDNGCLQQFLLTDSEDDLYRKDSITSDEPPVLHSEQPFMVVNTAPKHLESLQRTPLGGAEILSSCVLSGPHRLPSMTLVVLLLKELAWHQTRFTLPGLIVFWRENTVIMIVNTMRLLWAPEILL